MSAFHSSPSYDAALAQCQASPAYAVRLPSGDFYPCVCYPLMPADTYGWQVVKRKFRAKKVWTTQQLEEEADINNWEDVDHYGRATYARNDTTPAFEHNGALFDIGSRF